MNLIYALTASIVISAISLVGGLALLVSDRILNRAIIFMVALAAGGLIGGAFLDIIPEAMTYVNDTSRLFLYVILGYFIFFILEKYLHWRHCHDAKCEVHAFNYLNIVGDVVHNFNDGLIIGAIFSVDIKVGVAAALAIVIHEIPHELGNFMVLVYGGFSRSRALFFNFLSSLFAIAGTLAGFYFASRISGFSTVLLPVAAGGFIYIASCDLIPELHKENDGKRSAIIMLTFACGIAIMYVLKMLD